MEDSYYKVIPEEMVVNANKMSIDIGGDITNSFGKLLEVAAEYKKAEMTPVFLYDNQLNLLYCVAKETFKKILH